MPKFDRKDGIFISHSGVDVTYEERGIFKHAGWKYNRTDRFWWTDNYVMALDLRRYAIGDAKEHIDNAERIRDVAIAASHADKYDGEFPSPKGLSYLPFQKAGIAYALDGDDTLFADSPGLGKTVQAIGVHNVRNFDHILVLCPASLKINWSREWARWDVHGKTIGIAGPILRREDKKTYTEHVWPDTDVVIVNYDMLEAFDAQIKAITWGLFIADESHNLKTNSTIRGRCVFGGEIAARRDKTGKITKKKQYKAPIKAETRLFLTGTPVLSRPVELWTTIKAFDPDGLGRSYDAFVHEFCAAEQNGFTLNVSGASNENKLQQMLRAAFMVRRDKRTVLPELPDKIREPILLPYDKLKNPIKKEKTRVDKALEKYEKTLGIAPRDNDFWYITKVDEITSKLDIQDVDSDNRQGAWENAVNNLSEPERILFTEMSEAREEVALAKAGLVVEHVVKLCACEEPVILFAHHKSVVKELKKQLENAGLRVGILVGGTSLNARQQAVDDFQEGKLDVILGNIIAMGVGWTLTRARFVVFAELDWVPAMIEQAEDRAWRIGQKNAVIVQHLLVDGSIEALMATRLLEKMGVISNVLDM